MKILAIGQVEEDEQIIGQIAKQTVQPDVIRLHVDSTPAKGIEARRKRIALNHAYLKSIVEDVKPDLVWQLESDSVLPNDALERLLTHWKSLNYTDTEGSLGYVSGVQVGRHGLYHLGAWHVDTDHEMFASLDYKAQGIQLVDATGFYCLLASARVWLKGKAEWNGEPYGPDVNFGLSLRKLGYNIYVDPQLHVGHRYKNYTIRVDAPSTCNVVFSKKGDKWEYETYD